MTKDPSTVPWLENSPPSHKVLPRGKKKKMHVSVKVRYEKPSQQKLLELLFLQGLGIVSVK